MLAGSPYSLYDSTRMGRRRSSSIRSAEEDRAIFIIFDCSRVTNVRGTKMRAHARALTWRSYCPPPAPSGQR